MTNGNSPTALGFLTVLADTEQGLYGGYLVLNAAGRPLEFHCTAPVKANRAQQILYGPTLAPFLYGEQIGKALLEKGQTNPDVVFTDVAPALAARAFADMPLVLIEHGQSEAGEDRRLRRDPAHAALPPNSAGWIRFSLGAQPAAVPAGQERDRQRVVSAWQAQEKIWDLSEPFWRIREAMEEAQRGAR